MFGADCGRTDRPASAEGDAVAVLASVERDPSMTAGAARD